MQRFFNKRIKNAMQTGKSSPNFSSALREIVLLVIGILIALFINNWNVDRIEKKELKSYLQNIKKNMIADQKTIKEIAVFRDSSRQYSNFFLQAAAKDHITYNDLSKIMTSRYNVFFDNYLKTRSSGFDALKSSGFIGKINDSPLEELLNEYYFTTDLIDAQENSLYFTVKSMENQVVINNIRQKLIRIFEMSDAKELENEYQSEVLELLNYPSLFAANNRNFMERKLPELYDHLSEIGKSIIDQIE